MKGLLTILISPTPIIALLLSWDRYWGTVVPLNFVALAGVLGCITGALYMYGWVECRDSLEKWQASRLTRRLQEAGSKRGAT